MSSTTVRQSPAGAARTTRRNAFALLLMHFTPAIVTLRDMMALGIEEQAGKFGSPRRLGVKGGRRWPREQGFRG